MREESQLQAGRQEAELRSAMQEATAAQMAAFKATHARQVQAKLASMRSALEANAANELQASAPRKNA